jgi:hypothetical protein
MSPTAHNGKEDMVSKQALMRIERIGRPANRDLVRILFLVASGQVQAHNRLPAAMLEQQSLEPTHLGNNVFVPVTPLTPTATPSPPPPCPR